MRLITALVVYLGACTAAAPALAQQRPPTQDELRARAIERCKSNRGVDCESAEGLREWIQQEQPITDEQRRAAAAARRVQIQRGHAR
jgi:hypothetical protein